MDKNMLNWTLDHPALSSRNRQGGGIGPETLPVSEWRTFCSPAFGTQPKRCTKFDGPASQFTRSSWGRTYFKVVNGQASARKCARCIDLFRVRIEQHLALAYIERVTNGQQQWPAVDFSTNAMFAGGQMQQRPNGHVRNRMLPLVKTDQCCLGHEIYDKRARVHKKIHPDPILWLKLENYCRIGIEIRE